MACVVLILLRNMRVSGLYSSNSNHNATENLYKAGKHEASPQQVSGIGAACGRLARDTCGVWGVGWITIIDGCA